MLMELAGGVFCAWPSCAALTLMTRATIRKILRLNTIAPFQLFRLSADGRRASVSYERKLSESITDLYCFRSSEEVCNFLNEALGLWPLAFGLGWLGLVSNTQRTR